MRERPTGTTRRRYSVYLRVGFALVLILVILQIIDLDDVIRSIVRSDWRYVPLIIALALVDRYLMAYKWAMLMRARGIIISNIEAFSIYIASGFVGAFLPLGVGADFFKLTRTSLGGASFNEVTASIFMERVLGLVAIAVLAIAGLSFILLDNKTQFLGFYYFAWIALTTTLTLLYLSTRSSTSSWVASRATRLTKYRLTRMILDSYRAYAQLGGQQKILAWFFLLSLVEHCILCLLNIAGARSLGFRVHAVYFFAIVPLSSLLGALPISIQGIGVTEGLYIVLFSLAGMSSNQSLSLALYMRAMGLLMLTPGAIIFLTDFVRLRRLHNQGKS